MKFLKERFCTFIFFTLSLKVNISFSCECTPQTSFYQQQWLYLWSDHCEISLWSNKHIHIMLKVVANISKSLTLHCSFSNGSHLTHCLILLLNVLILKSTYIPPSETVFVDMINVLEYIWFIFLYLCYTFF